MDHTTLWIDHEHAYIFKFVQEKVYRKSLTKKPLPPTDSPRKFTSMKEHRKQFYQLIANELGTPGPLLILGPGVAKTEFKHFCEQNHQTTIAKSIVAVSTMKSNPRKSQIMKATNDFFSS